MNLWSSLSREMLVPSCLIWLVLAGPCHDLFALSPQDAEETLVSPQQTLFLAAEQSYADGDFSQAISQWNQLIAEHGESLLANESRYRIGCVYYQQESYADALASFESVAKQLDDLKALSAGDHLLLCLGFCYFQDGKTFNADAAAQLQIAIHTFQSVAETFPESLLRDQAALWHAAANAELIFLKPIQGQGNLADQDEVDAAANRAIVDAATNYARVVDAFGESPLAASAALAAAKLYFRAGEHQLAEPFLLTAAKTSQSLFAEATHWKCRILLLRHEYALAYEIATSVGPEHSQSPYYPNLIMDAADAMTGLPEKKSDAVPLFLRVVTHFPEHVHAPFALYRATQVCWETGQDRWGVDLVKQFEKEYPFDGLMIEMLQLKGECALRAGQGATASIAFRDLEARFPTHALVTHWQLRRAWASYLQQKYDPTIAALLLLNPSGLSHEQGLDRQYLLGASHFGNQDFAKALDQLQKFILTAPQHYNANAARILKARAHGQIGDSTLALPLLESVVANSMVADEQYEAIFWQGELAYRAQEFPKATERFQYVVDHSSDFKFVPDCLYGLAWAQFKANKYQDSVESFAHMLRQFPDHPLVEQATLGRGMASRLAGQFQQAADDLESHLAGNPAGDVFSVRYELGLAYIGLQNWSDAVRVLQPLVGLTQQVHVDFGDDVRYELALANLHLERGGLLDTHESKRLLTELIDQYPDSPLVADAYYQIAQQAFTENDFPRATTGFLECLEQDPLPATKEKALHRLGWCYFNAKDFTQAHQVFTDLTEGFPDSDLAADGLMRASESLFRGERHELAVSSYKRTLVGVKDAREITDQDRRLAAIYGARSANYTGDHQSALEFVMPISNALEKSGQTADAWLEMGIAHDGLGEHTKAITAWLKAIDADEGDRAGAQARCLLAQKYLESQDYQHAIEQFRLVVSGYGGSDSSNDIRPWQAYAAYEAARSHYLQIDDSSSESQRRYLLGEAKRLFGYIVENYPGDSLYDRAKGQLDFLEKLPSAK